MSPYVRPDKAVLRDLERLLAHLTEELAGWRRRCLKAESELQTVKGQQGMVPGDELFQLRARLLDMERENLDLNARVNRTKDMVQTLRHRLAFVEPVDVSEGAS